MSWSGTRNWHPAQDRNGRSSAVHSQPNRKSIQHHANIYPRLIRFLFNQNVSTNHGIIQSHRDTTLSLHPWWGNSILSSRDSTYSTVFQQEKQITLRVPVTSSKENSDAHQTKRTKTHIECLRRRLGINEGSDTCGDIFFFSKFTPRDYTNYSHRPMDGFLFPLFLVGDGHLFYLLSSGPSPFGSISAGFPSSTSRTGWSVEWMGWWLKLEKSSWGFET